MGVVEGRKFGLLDCYLPINAGTEFHDAFQCIDMKTERIEWYHVHCHLISALWRTNCDGKLEVLKKYMENRSKLKKESTQLRLKNEGFRIFMGEKVVFDENSSDSSMISPVYVYIMVSMLF